MISVLCSFHSSCIISNSSFSLNSDFSVTGVHYEKIIATAMPGWYNTEVATFADTEHRKGTRMTKKDIRNFLQLHPYKEFSAARFEYSIYYNPEMLELANLLTSEFLVPSDEDIEQEQDINKADNAKELIRLMRKPMSGTNQHLLRKKLFQYENELLPLIQNKALTNRQDIFIENAFTFFLYSQNNYCDWIMQNYTQMNSEYMKSMLCLVLGFRGDVSLIPFLMKETERFERDYPLDDYEQAPTLAVQELATRFMGY